MSAETIPVRPASSLFAPPYMPPGAIVMSVQEYLNFERDSEIKYEYVDFYAFPKEGVEILENGEIRAMSGVSPPHNVVAGNVFAKIHSEIGERAYDVYMSDIKVRVSNVKYRYPDVAALCGDAQFDDADPPCLLNPSVLVEVLSPSTQHIDKGVKFDEYKGIATVTDYVLIEQARMFVTHYIRQSAAHWTVTDYELPTDILTFSTLEVSISLAEIYRKIVFPSPTVS